MKTGYFNNKYLKLTNATLYVLLAPVLFLKSHFLFRNIKSKKLLSGLDVMVLGSSSNPRLPRNFKKLTLVCCNASAANAKALKLQSVYITVVDNEVIDPKIAFEKKARRDILRKNLLKDIYLGYLFAVQSNPAKGGSPSLLGAKYNEFAEIDIKTRRKIIKSVSFISEIDSRPDLLTSTGGFAVAFAFFLGAKSVTISGFTFLESSKSYFFSKNKNLSKNKINTRSHSLADSLLFSSLASAGYKIYSEEPEILPLLQNWGNSSKVLHH
jgi:hypothetical protein